MVSRIRRVKRVSGVRPLVGSADEHVRAGARHVWGSWFGKARQRREYGDTP